MPSRATGRPRARSRSSRMRASSTRSARACSCSRARRTSTPRRSAVQSGRRRRALARRPEVTALHAPVASKDGHSSLIEFDLKGPSGSADARVVPVLAAVASVQRAHPAFRIAEFGEASADRARQRHGRRRLRARRAAVGAADVPDPAARLRRVRRRGVAGAARALRRARLGRRLGAREPRLSRRGHHELDDPADGHGRRGRLLALLREARARGASRGPLRPAMRCTVPPRPRAVRC